MDVRVAWKSSCIVEVTYCWNLSCVWLCWYCGCL